MSKENKLKQIKISKIVLNMGVGEPGESLKRAEKILQQLVPVKPVQTVGRKKIPTWGVREGLPLGVKTTLRGKIALEFLERALIAKGKQLHEKYFDRNGNFSFGIKEYIDLPGVKYDPKLGIMGLDVCVVLERPGFRVKKRKLKSKIGKTHLISKEEAINFMKTSFGVEIEK